MTGWKTGVAARLKLLNPFMLTYHCIAHRLALACADAAAEMNYPEQEEKVINEISSYPNNRIKAVIIIQLKRPILTEIPIIK